MNRVFDVFIKDVLPSYSPGRNKEYYRELLQPVPAKFKSWFLFLSVVAGLQAVTLKDAGYASFAIWVLLGKDVFKEAAEMLIPPEKKEEKDYVK